MGDIRTPDNKDLAYKDYISGMKYKEIAAKYNVSMATVKSWKTRYKWDRKSMHTKKDKKEKVCTQNRNEENLKPSDNANLNNLDKKRKESSETNSQNPKARYGNKNALGNAGGNGGPPGNKKAEIHGLYAKYLPEETMELIELIKSKDRLDILWEQIVIQYVAIIRAQKIMYVTDKEEIIKELKKEESSEYGQKTEWEFQFAWDRQASFLNAQSRAMSELRSLIKQYDTMVNANWDLVTDEQKHRVEKLKLEISNIRGDSKDNSTENWVNSIKVIAEKRKNERNKYNG